MSKQYTISELAKAADIPTTTLRYYERIGIVCPEKRSHGNYRLYRDESLKKVKFIRAAQAIGFTLDDIKVLLTEPECESVSCVDVQNLIEARLAEVALRLKDLGRVRKVLKKALEKCHDPQQASTCHMLETLQQSSVT